MNRQNKNKTKILKFQHNLKSILKLKLHNRSSNLILKKNVSFVVKISIRKNKMLVVDMRVMNVNIPKG